MKPVDAVTLSRDEGRIFFRNPAETSYHSELQKLQTELESGLRRLPLPEATLLEIREMSRETQAELYLSSLLSLGIRLKREARIAEAQVLLSFAEGAAKRLHCGEIGERASLEFAALAGTSASYSALRTEFLLSRFASQATDPAAILSMAAGTAAFSWMRAGVLARLTASPAGWATRGLGARVVSGLVGFAVEVPSFTFSARGLRWARGEVLETPLSHDLGSAALSLGVLKMAGLSPVSPAASAGLGLMAAHYLEGEIGWRPSADFSNLVAEGLSSWLALQVGAHLAHRLFPVLGELQVRGSFELHSRPTPAGALVREIDGASLLHRPFLMSVFDGEDGPPKSVPPSAPSRSNSAPSIHKMTQDPVRFFFRELDHYVEENILIPYREMIDENGYLFAGLKSDLRVAKLLLNRSGEVTGIVPIDLGDLGDRTDVISLNNATIPILTGKWRGFGVLERPFLNAKQAATLEALEKSEENINGFKSFPKVNSDAFLRLFSSEWKLSFVKGLSRVLLEARQGQDQALAPYRATFDLYPAMTGYLTLPQNAKPNPQGMTAVFRLTVRPLRDVDPKFRASELEYDVLSGGLPEEVKDLLELLRGYSWSDGEEWLGD